MDNNHQNEEWYILESMKATQLKDTRDDKKSVEDKEAVSQPIKDGWFSLEGMEATQTTNSASGPNKSINSLIGDGVNTEDKIDFSISSGSKNEMTPSSSAGGPEKSSFDEGSSRSISSSRNLRLLLQESVDGEISNSSKSSGFSDNVESTEDSNATRPESRAIFSPGDVGDVGDDDDAPNDEWVNLTTVSNMQDVDRPEPLGRPTLSTLPPSKQQSSVTNTPLIGATAQPDDTINERTTASSKRTDAAEKSSNVSRLSSASKTSESDIQELSYTQSSVDYQYLNKRIGPAQDVKLLQKSSTELLSSLSSSSTDVNIGLLASRYSNETPVTKLLGPAYKQTERFLKDLQNAKLSYVNKDTSLGTNEMEYSLDSTLITHSSGISSRDESCQVGKSKLEYTMRTDITTNSRTKKGGELEYTTKRDNTTYSRAKESGELEFITKIDNTTYSRAKESAELEFTTRTDITNTRAKESGELVEQDIASASILDEEINGVNITSGSMAHHRVGSNDEQSEGELLISELSESLNLDSNRKSRSTTPRTVSSNPSSQGGLEPIQEVRSPDKTNFTPKGIIEDNQVDSFFLNSIQHPISSTSTPYAEVNEKPSVRGIYDIRNSTSPGSTNRKKIVKGEPLKNTGKPEKQRDPFKVYVSDESKRMVGSTESSLRTSDFKTEDFEDRVETTQKYFINTKKRIGDRSLSSERVTLSSSASESTLSHETDNRSKSRLSYSDDNNLDSTTATESRRSSSPRRRSLPKASYVFPKDINSTLSDSSYNDKSRVLIEGKPGRKDDKRKSFRDASLNDLWNSFERSYREASHEKSPLLKKLEIVSSLLQDSRQRSLNRRHKVSMSDSSDTSATFCESHTPFNLKHRQESGDEVVTSVLSDIQNFPNNNYEKRQTAVNNVCPVCRRREIGTNFPTPSASDMEQNKKAEPPLTLQTWTQTSPYIIDNSRFSKYAQDQNKENRKDSTIRHTPRAKKHQLKRKETYTVTSPGKLNQSRTSENYDRKRKDKREIPYTAWFQSVRSDVSEIIPLCNIPGLSSAYSDKQEKKLKSQRENRSIPNANLQEAFLQHKQHFIQRSKARVQGVKDGCLQEKHGERLARLQNTNNRVQQQGTITTEKTTTTLPQGRTKSVHRRTDNKEKPTRIKSRTPSFSRRSQDESPRNFQQLQEQHVENLRHNRLKMKQYDLKNRERFLKRRATTQRHQCFVVRH